MQLVLQRGSIDNTLIFDVYNSVFIPVCSLYTCKGVFNPIFITFKSNCAGTLVLICRSDTVVGLRLGFCCLQLAIYILPVQFGNISNHEIALCASTSPFPIT